MKPTSPFVGLVLVLEPAISGRRRNRIRALLEARGVRVRHVEGVSRSYLEIEGDDLPIRSLSPESWDGVDKVVVLTPGYPQASWGGGRGDLVTPTRVHVGPVPVGAGHFAIMAGPCAVEGAESALRLAREVMEAGAQVFRGGAYKPRTSPYAFQGLGEAGLAVLRDVREQSGLPIATEVMDTEDIERVAEASDLLQVGSRNMQNFSLLKKLARIRRPILLKRGFAATLDELLHAAEYLLSGGNDQVILCERGIRSAAGVDGVILDLAAIPELRRRTHLPIIVDPSHGSRASHRVAPLARAAVAAGADGLLIEVHHAPEEALSDGRQALTVAAFRQLVREVFAIRSVFNATAEPRPVTAVQPAGEE